MYALMFALMLATTPATDDVVPSEARADKWSPEVQADLDAKYNESAMCMIRETAKLEPSGEPSKAVTEAAMRICRMPILAFWRALDAASKTIGADLHYDALSDDELLMKMSEAYGQSLTLRAQRRSMPRRK